MSSSSEELEQKLRNSQELEKGLLDASAEYVGRRPSSSGRDTKRISQSCPYPPYYLLFTHLSEPSILPRTLLSRPIELSTVGEDHETPPSCTSNNFYAFGGFSAFQRCPSPETPPPNPVRLAVLLHQTPLQLPFLHCIPFLLYSHHLGPGLLDQAPKTSLPLNVLLHSTFQQGSARKNG